MKLIMARHGNTFAPADKVFWVGSENDLPLVTEGLAQAERFGDALATVGDVAAIYHAPLRRTKEFAEIAAKKLKNSVPLIVDDRLTELNYGQWNGKSDSEIVELFGQNILSDWVDKSAWPQGCDWGQSPEIVENQIKDLIDHLQVTYPADSTIVIISSNGKMRYFLKLIESEFEKRVADQSFKVGTGKVCVLQLDGKKAQVKAWNEAPQALLAGACK